MQTFATLEYHLGTTFSNSAREDLKSFWCDGVSPCSDNDPQISKKSVNDTRQITTKAWIGKTGQDEYQITIKFGPKSLSRYARNLTLDECLPDPGNMNWIGIDTKSRTIQIQLL